MADIVAVVLNRGGYFSVVTAPKSYYLRSDRVDDAESWVASLNESIGKGNSETTPLFSVDATKTRRSLEFQPLQEKNSLTLPQPSAKNQIIDSPVNLTLQGGTQQPSSPGKNEDYSNMSSPSRLSKIDVSSSAAKSLVPGSHMSCYPYSGTEDLGQSSCPSNHSLQLDSANLDNDELDDNAIKARVPINETLIPSAAQQLQQGNAETVGETEQALEPFQIEEKVLEAGYLLRLKKRYRHWRKQYIVLTSERMMFYKHEKSKAPLKVIKISKLIDVVEQDAMSKTKQYCMLLITPEKRMKFCAQSEEELVRWLSAIKALIDESMSANSVEA